MRERYPMVRMAAVEAVLLSLLLIKQLVQLQLLLAAAEEITAAEIIHTERMEVVLTLAMFMQCQVVAVLEEIMLASTLHGSLLIQEL